MGSRSRIAERFAKKLNENGLVLTDLLLSLACLTVIASLLAPSISVMQSSKRQAERQLQEMEWTVFYTQASNELRSASSIQVLPNRLTFKSGTETILYEKLGSNVRRRVNYTGHEVLLQNVGELAFKLTGKHVIIQITDLQGQKYEGAIYPFIPWEIQS